MEFLGSVWQIGLIALAAGILIGILAYRIYSASTSETDQVRAELDETRDELEQYKASVQSHFDKTSELFNDLTQNYAKVYRHLAEGAHTLGDSKTLNNLLEQQPGRVVIALDDETADVATREADDAAGAASKKPPYASLEDEAEVASARADEIDFVVGAATADSDDTTAGTASEARDPGIGDVERVDWEAVSPAAGAEPPATGEARDESESASVETDEGRPKPRKKQTEPA